MKITADWKDAEGKGLKDIGWALEYEGTIESEEAIEIDIGHKWFKISGSLKSMFSTWHQSHLLSISAGHAYLGSSRPLSKVM